MMGSEGFEDNKMLGPRATTIHKRSKSLPGKNSIEEDESESSLVTSRHLKLDMECLKDHVKIKKKHSSKTEAKNSLKKEITQLEKRLQDQFHIRRAMEKALGYRALSYNSAANVPLTKLQPATELIKEIAVLELEVVHLEQYLLSLYRKAFDQQISSVSPPSKDERLKSTVPTPRHRFLDASPPDITSRKESSHLQSGCQTRQNLLKEFNHVRGEENLLDSGVHRCDSSLSQHSAFSPKASPSAESLGRAVRACHSQPLSMVQFAQNASNIISLAEHLGTHLCDHFPESPNKLSEDMIKCMSAIYCKLADPPLMNNGLSSPNSSLSSASVLSSRDQCDMWSPGFRNSSSFDVRLDNPFLVEGLKEFSGPYSTTIEVSWIYRDSQKLGDVEHLLQNYRSLICQLEEVNPRKLKHGEKLAFWVNVHNALMMHAFLAYGIPQNNVKRVLSLLKAAYNVGGYTISADTIQSSILGCRMSCPRQWLRLLLPSRSKFKRGDERQAYAIERPEPLLHFALCSGSHSDPAVRVYTSKRVFQELEVAKEEYIRATFGVRKDQKILLPKIVESFAKDSGLCQTDIIEMIQKSFPDFLWKGVKKCLQGKPRKSIITWIPHNFTFRYLVSKELVR